MKYILLYILLPLIMIGCSTDEIYEPQIKSSNPQIKTVDKKEFVEFDPIRKIVYHLGESPHEWRKEEKVHGNNSYIILYYGETGLSITNKSVADINLGWTISRPTILKLTDEESDKIEKAYVIWEIINSESERREISDILGGVPNVIEFEKDNPNTKKKNTKYSYNPN